MAKRGIITALDVGTSKIVCFIAYTDHHGNVKVAGIGHQVSQGIKAGIVMDVKQAEAAILAAVHAAEKMAAETIDGVLINVIGHSVQSHQMSVDTDVSGHEITQRDIAAIIRQGREAFSGSELEVLHCLPIEYALDGADGIRDPRGMYGDALCTRLHVMTGSSTTLRNLSNCLARCHLGVDAAVAATYMSGLACLTEDEKNLGAVLLDIGAGNTGIAIFSGGQPVYLDSIAVGGLHITRDLAQGLSTTLHHAERIKTLHGSVMGSHADERDMIDVPHHDAEADMASGDGATEDRYVSKALLTSIIRPRAEEILEMARKRLENSELYPLIGSRLVLTGGCSQLQGMRELASQVFSKHVRLARPKMIDGMAESTRSGAFSCVTGMLLYAAEQMKQQKNIKQLGYGKVGSHQGNRFARLSQWFKENF